MSSHGWARGAPLGPAACLGALGRGPNCSSSSSLRRLVATSVRRAARHRSVHSPSTRRSGPCGRPSSQELGPPQHRTRGSWRRCSTPRPSCAPTSSPANSRARRLPRRARLTPKSRRTASTPEHPVVADFLLAADNWFQAYAGRLRRGRSVAVRAAVRQRTGSTGVARCSTRQVRTDDRRRSAGQPALRQARAVGRGLSHRIVMILVVGSLAALALRLPRLAAAAVDPAVR